MAELALVATAVGTVVKSVGTLAEGDAAKQAADYKATQYDQQAQESRASSQRSALESRRKADLSASRVQAVSAASGGGASDPTVANIEGDIAARGEYQALVDMYKGENRARGLEDEATGQRMTGEAKKTASRYSAFGTILDGASSFGSQYKKAYG